MHSPQEIDIPWLHIDAATFRSIQRVYRDWLKYQNLYSVQYAQESVMVFDFGEFNFIESSVLTNVQGAKEDKAVTLSTKVQMPPVDMMEAAMKEICEAQGFFQHDKLINYARREWRTNVTMFEPTLEREGYV
jgi:hypothetical protein